MTELATPPVEREQDVERISHWIGGRLVEGGSGRSGPVYNPALGLQTGAVDFATLARGFGIASAGPITSPADLPAALNTAIEAVASGEPYLLDVVTEPR